MGTLVFGAVAMTFDWLRDAAADTLTVPGLGGKPTARRAAGAESDPHSEGTAEKACAK